MPLRSRQSPFRRFWRWLNSRHDGITPEQAAFIASTDFLRTPEWRRLRYDTIKRYGARCMACGRTPRKHGIAINVDHIKNRRDFPWLALNPENLQVLCADDNAGKGNRDSTDWR